MPCFSFRERCWHIGGTRLKVHNISCRWEMREDETMINPVGHPTQRNEQTDQTRNLRPRPPAEKAKDNRAASTEDTVKLNSTTDGDHDDDSKKLCFGRLADRI